MQRARETTATLEHRWNAVALVDARVGEIQSPSVPREQRKDWLRDILLRRWSELGQPHDRWRSNVLQAVLGIREDTIVFSHSVAINVAVEFAMGDDRVTPIPPANCSCTVMDAKDGRLRMLELGNEDASGRIL